MVDRELETAVQVGLLIAYFPTEIQGFFQGGSIQISLTQIELDIAFQSLVAYLQTGL